MNLPTSFLDVRQLFDQKEPGDFIIEYADSDREYNTFLLPELASLSARLEAPPGLSDLDFSALFREEVDDERAPVDVYDYNLSALFRDYDALEANVPGLHEKMSSMQLQQPSPVSTTGVY